MATRLVKIENSALLVRRCRGHHAGRLWHLGAMVMVVDVTVELLYSIAMDPRLKRCCPFRSGRSNASPLPEATRIVFIDTRLSVSIHSSVRSGLE